MKHHSRCKGLWLQCTIGLLWLATVGCGTLEEPYRPNRVGPIENPSLGNPIDVQILSAQDTITIGDPLYFTVIIRNTSDEPVWLPRNPDLLMTWIYPNGQRDNFLREHPEAQFFSRHNAVLLHPGQQMTRTIAVKTYYFPLPGITEFRAILRAARNTNPDLQPFWSGRAESNAYGVKVLKRSRRSLKTLVRESGLNAAFGFTHPTARANREAESEPARL